MVDRNAAYRPKKEKVKKPAKKRLRTGSYPRRDDPTTPRKRGAIPLYTRPDAEVPRYTATPEERELLIAKVVELRVKGHTLNQVAQMIGYGYEQTRRFEKMGYERHNTLTVEHAAMLRKMQIDRIDNIYATHAAKLDDDRSANVCLRALERHAKLLGLDAPEAIIFPDARPPAQHDLSKLSVQQLRDLRTLLATTAVEPVTSVAALAMEEGSSEATVIEGQAREVPGG